MRRLLNFKVLSLTTKNDEDWTNPFNPYHCRAARALARWSISDLSVKSGVSAETIGRFERSAKASAKTASLLRTAFESIGVSFAGTHMPTVAWDQEKVRALRATVAQLGKPVIEHED